MFKSPKLAAPSSELSIDKSTNLIHSIIAELETTIYYLKSAQERLKVAENRLPTLTTQNLTDTNF